MNRTIRSRLILMGASLAAAAAALVLIITAVQAAAPASTEANQVDANSAREFRTIRALRLISIPFGINSPAGLLPTGDGVITSGHGDCPAGSENYKIRVKVSQEGVPAPAVGSTQGSCSPGERIMWSADALLPGAFAFEPGTAEVCAKAVVQRDQAGAMTFEWCKSVALTE